jgi:methylglyoxal reductase
MSYRRLGARGPELSVIGLGGWEAGGGNTWGPNAADGEVVAALRGGWDLGANWIDTAEVYAHGRSEELIGRALEGHDGVRVMTKVGPRPDGSGVRAREIAGAVAGSLRRLRRDSIDVYLMHWRDAEVPLQETWGAMTELVERGLVQHIGLSNVCATELQQCGAIGRVDVLQLQGSLLFRDELDELVPICRRIGAGVVCYGALAYGLLAGGYSGRGDDWRKAGDKSDDFFVLENYARFFSPTKLPSHLRRVSALRQVASELGVTAAQAALAWLVAQPGVSGAIVGSRCAAHTRENLAAGSIELGEEDLRRVQESVSRP